MNLIPFLSKLDEGILRGVNYTELKTY